MADVFLRKRGSCIYQGVLACWCLGSWQVMGRAIHFCLMLSFESFSFTLRSRVRADLMHSIGLGGYTDDELNGKQLLWLLDAQASSIQPCSSDARFNGLDEDLLCSADFPFFAAPLT